MRLQPLSANPQTPLPPDSPPSTPGLTKLRAGFPPGTKIGDKTGSGPHGSNNDVAIIWLPNLKPILIASYLTESPRAIALHS